MLTHSINIYKPPQSTYQQHSVVPLNQNNIARMGKFEYNMYLNKQPFKRGDIVVGKSIPDLTGVTKYAIYKVIDIQEIHYSVEYDIHSQKPRCLHLKNVDKWDFWTVPENWCICPPEVIERLGLVEWSKE